MEMNPLKILLIDLTKEAVREMEVNQSDVKLYLGGKGLAYKILLEQAATGVDPLSEENVIAFMTGLVTGSGAPLSGRFTAVSKSPLTELYGASSCGGPFGVALRTAGYMGLVVKGKSKEPVKIEVNPRGIIFEPAKHLWGKLTGECQTSLNLGPHDGALVIGPAGENLVKFANIRSGDRFLGRLGFGAVLGSKNVKAIVIRGGVYKINPTNPEVFARIKKVALRRIQTNNFTELYRKYGTNTNMFFSKESSILPVRNFSSEIMPEEVSDISGPYLEERYETKPRPCSMCSLICGHKTRIGGHEYNVPEYETMALFGPNCGIFDFEKIVEFNEICNELGLDTMSSAVTISFLMEAKENELIDSNLRFGDPNGILEFLPKIAYKEGLGAEAANGTKYLSEKYGGKEFAMHVKGLELAAYNPKNSVGQGLAYAVANRGGCHLSAPVFIVEAYLKYLNPRSPKSKAYIVAFLENLFNVINSMGICIFTSFAYILENRLIKTTPAFLVRTFMQLLPRISTSFLDISLYRNLLEAITGMKFSRKDLLKVGERIHILERYMNVREGVSKELDTLPERLLKGTKAIPLEKMLRDYYRIRGYDNQGKPQIDILRSLKIDIS